MHLVKVALEIGDIVVEEKEQEEPRGRDYDDGNGQLEARERYPGGRLTSTEVGGGLLPGDGERGGWWGPNVLGAGLPRTGTQSIDV